MTDTVPDILARIVAKKRLELADAAASREDWERRAEESRAGRRDFRAALASTRPAVIAEIKRASPSKGALAAGVDPARIAREYERGGAAALSVLTDRSFFQGSLEDLRAARQAVRLPVLRKDFTLEGIQVVEAAAHGADAILLIVAILNEEQIRNLRQRAADYGMAALVEVHNERELETAIAAGAEVIGVNNRNLMTFEVTLETSLRLADRIPRGVVKVSESGIYSPAHIELLQRAGYEAFLVGEHLMRSGEPAAAVRALVSPA